jgi:hypothetical protein
MSKARHLGNLLDTDGDVNSNSLDNVPTPSKTSIEALGIDLPADNLTGSIANARIPESAVTQHVTAPDLTPVHQSIATLGLHMGVSANAAAFNLPNAFIDTFEDDTGLTTQTNVDRVTDGEYVASVYQADGTQVEISRTAGTAQGTLTGRGGLSAAFNGDTTQGHTSSAGMSSLAAQGYIGKDWGSGTTYRVSGVELWPADGSSYGPIGYDSNLGNSSHTITVILEGSTDNFSSSVVDLGQVITGVDTNDTSGQSQLSGFTYTTAYRYHRIKITTTNGNMEAVIGQLKFYQTPLSTTANATGTLISDTQTAPAATTEVSGVILYKDNAGTATLGTHLKIYFTANNGTNWTEAASYETPQTFSGTTKQVKLGKTTVTSGTQVKLKAVWASQASGSMETQLHGWAVNY